MIGSTRDRRPGPGSSHLQGLNVVLKPSGLLLIPFPQTHCVATGSSLGHAWRGPPIACTLCLVNALRVALQAKKRAEPRFNGTPSAASKLLVSVSHQTVANLLDGSSPPWHVRVHTMNELLRLLRRHGLRAGDFATPRAELKRLDRRGVARAH